MDPIVFSVIEVLSTSDFFSSSYPQVYLSIFPLSPLLILLLVFYHLNLMAAPRWSPLSTRLVSTNRAGPFLSGPPAA
jgi:hypothetical protein